MPGKPKRDENEAAFDVVQKATEGVDSNKDTTPAKDPAAVSLGRRGGLKGGRARAEKLSKKRRSAIARKAAKSRWRK